MFLKPPFWHLCSAFLQNTTISSWPASLAATHVSAAMSSPLLFFQLVSYATSCTSVPSAINPPYQFSKPFPLKPSPVSSSPPAMFSSFRRCGPWEWRVHTWVTTLASWWTTKSSVSRSMLPALPCIMVVPWPFWRRRFGSLSPLVSCSLRRFFWFTSLRWAMRSKIPFQLSGFFSEKCSVFRLRLLTTNCSSNV